MEFLLNRYRNLTVLLVVLFAQLILLAYQVKTNKDVPLIRVWAVSTVTPVEQGLEFIRRNTIGVVEDYFVLIRVREQNEQLRKQMDQLKLENHFLRTELSTADRVKQLSVFQANTPSKTLAARIIGTGTAANSKVVYIDRGSASGVEAGMAVITPDGIVGKVVSAFPTASLLLLVTDPSFAAGVISQKNHVHGTLKGQGGPKCRVDYVQNEEKVEEGEWFYTAGDDRIFPRGFPVGQVASVKNGRSSKEIYLTPSGLQGGTEEVLVVTEGVHQAIPTAQVASTEMKLLPVAPDTGATGATGATSVLNTDADKLRQVYRQVGEQEKFTYGAPSPKPPDFTKLGNQQTAGAAVKPAPAPGQAPAQPGQSSTQPGQQAAQPRANATAAPPSGGTGATGQPARPAVVPNKPATAKPATASEAANTGTPPKPKARPPALVTDPTDSDPATEALYERVQKERSTPRVVAGDDRTEILAPTPAPKKKSEVTPGEARPAASRPAVPKMPPAKPAATPSKGSHPPSP